jgi:hypothetical protein
MKKYLAIAGAAILLSACGPSPVPAMPQTVNEAGQVVAQKEGFHTGDAAVGALAGAAAGYMMGKGSSANNQPRTIIVDNTRRGNYGYNDYRGRKTITTTTTSRGFGGKTVTRTTTKRR